MKLKKPPDKTALDRQHRAELGSRFRAMYRSLALDRPGVAKLLHVSERTLHNWETGRHLIPYAAYRLLRLECRADLPGAAWAGWSFVAGALVSPEGHRFIGSDCNWWSLFVRRARLFHIVYRENIALRRALGDARPAERDPQGARRAGSEAPATAASEACGGRRGAPDLNLLKGHISTEHAFTPSVAMFSIANILHSGKRPL